MATKKQSAKKKSNLPIGLIAGAAVRWRRFGGNDPCLRLQFHSGESGIPGQSEKHGYGDQLTGARPLRARNSA